MNKQEYNISDPVERMECLEVIVEAIQQVAEYDDEETKDVCKGMILQFAKEYKEADVI